MGRGLRIGHSAVVVTGLDFPSNDISPAQTVQFRFTGANLLSPFPATYIWRIRPRQQTGFYTTFFWGRGDGTFGGNGYYGAHPYPVGGSSGTTHNWEVSADGEDVIVDDNAHDTTVVKDVWYTQALTVEEVTGSEVLCKFYWDLPDLTKVITFNSSVDNSNYATTFPPTSPTLAFGDAPWSPGNECLSGVLRGVQIYDAKLTTTDIQTEAANDTVNTPQTAAGLAAVWYMNQNPTPSDIADKSGEGHDPAWHNANRPTLYEA